MPKPNLSAPPADPKDMPAWGRNLVVLLNNAFSTVFEVVDGRANISSRRISTPAGAALGAGDVAISAGWGNTATFAVAGNDQRGSVSVTANGAGLAAQPTVTITFHDGKWRVAPFATASRGDVAAPLGALTTTCTTTTLVITFHGLPVAGSVYVLNWTTVG